MFGGLEGFWSVCGLLPPLLAVGSRHDPVCDR